MSDNLAVTPGSGKTILMDEVVEGTIGTGVVGFGKIMDGTLNSTNKLTINASGEAKVKATDSDALLTTIDADTGNIATSTSSVDAKLTTTNSTLGTIDADTGNIAGSTSAIDANAGATTDAAATAGSTGTISAKLRLITSQQDAIKTAVETIDNAISGSEMQVDVVGALPAGTNAIGKLSANSGIDIGDVDVTTVVPGTGATQLGKAEDAAHSSGDTGVFVLGVRNDTMQNQTSADGDYSPISITAGGRVLATKAPHGQMVRGTATTTGTSDTSLVAAAGASVKNYITSIQVVNTGSTTSLITFKDGSGGSTLGYTIAPAGGGSNVLLDTPLVTTANTAFYFAAASASTTIYVSAQGYKAP